MFTNRLITAEKKYAKTVEFRRFRKNIFHQSLVRIFQSLKPGMSIPIVMRCPDGHYRRVILTLGPYIADYPEQVLVTGIVSGWCPQCVLLSSCAIHS